MVVPPPAMIVSLALASTLETTMVVPLARPVAVDAGKVSVIAEPELKRRVFWKKSEVPKVLLAEAPTVCIGSSRSIVLVPGLLIEVPSVSGLPLVYGVQTSVEVFSVPNSTQCVASGVWENTHGFAVVLIQHSPANAAFPGPFAGAELPELQEPIERNAALWNEASPVIGSGEPGVTSVACEASAGLPQASQSTAIQQAGRLFICGFSLVVDGRYCRKSARTLRLQALEEVHLMAASGANEPRDIKTTIKKLEMRLRKRNSQTLRVVYRLVRSFQPFVASKDLPDELVRDCQFCSSRVAMLDRLARDGCVAELGTYRGDFAREILARNTPKELHLIDVDYFYFDQSLATDPRVKCHEGLTTATIAKFPDSYFDWIYIDAGHSYSAVLSDASACAAKIKRGGYLIFNDFAHIDPFLGRYGVHRAVIDFALERNWPLRLFAFNPFALYDVGLQKPAGE